MQIDACSQLNVMARTKQTLRKVVSPRYEQATFGHDLSNVYSDDVAEYATPDRKSKPKSKWLRQLENVCEISVSRKVRPPVASEATETVVLPIYVDSQTELSSADLPLTVAGQATVKQPVAIDPALQTIIDPGSRNNETRAASDIVWRYSPISSEAGEPVAAATLQSSVVICDAPSSVVHVASVVDNTDNVEEHALPEGSNVNATAPPKSRAARVKTRNLTCEYCDKQYKQRSGILRHLKKIHGLDARGKPVSVPKLDPVHPRTGGKYPPGIIWKSEAAAVACSRLDKRQRSPSPDVQPSRQFPVELLVRELDRQPTLSNQDIAKTLGHRFGWTQEDIDIVIERLSDLRAQRVDTAAHLRKLLPCDQSKKRIRLFLGQLQDMLDTMESAPE
jgi:uncharacterized C2H2 Zn-finger protein